MKKLTKLHAILIIVLLAILATAVYFSFSYQGAQAKQPDIKDVSVQRTSLTNYANDRVVSFDLTIILNSDVERI